jgi:hypothetical protein
VADLPALTQSGQRGSWLSAGAQRYGLDALDRHGEAAVQPVLGRMNSGRAVTTKSVMAPRGQPKYAAPLSFGHEPEQGGVKGDH